MNISSQLIASQLHPVVIDWVRRVGVNGGGLPSQNTVSCTNRLYVRLLQNNLVGGMKSLNGFAPDSLGCMMTPLINIFGGDPYTNNGFGSSDLSINGLKGTSGRYIDTQIVPTTAFISDNSAGATLYVSAGNNNAENDMGVWASSTPQMACYVNNGTSTFFDCWNNGTARITASNSAFKGYISFNRLNATTSSIYVGSSTQAHTTLVTSSTQTSIGTRPSVNMFIFRMNGTTVTSTKTFSFFAAHDGLSPSDSANFFQIIQAYRTEIGGGAV